jgi:DNA-binding XRE family transcriptional regulator
MPFRERRTGDRCGIDQEELAKKVGISCKTIALIETMKPGPLDPRRRRILEDLKRKMEVELNVEFIFAGEKSGEGVRIKRSR